MVLDESFRKWVSSIDTENIRVVRSPSLIFLCGGPVSKTSGANLESRRARFHQYIQDSAHTFKNQIILAEDIFKKFDQSAYTNLLQFESDLAHLCSVTIIFSESYGSIAELGSFAVLQTLEDKIIVVIDAGACRDQDSFIWRGPLTHLQQLSKKAGRVNPVNVYPWGHNGNNSVSDEDVRHSCDLIETLQGILDSFPKSESWDRNKPAHIMLLILDLLQIIGVGTADDIFKVLKEFSVDIQENRTKQYLSLLVSLNYADKKNYGNYCFYFPVKSNWINWRYNKGAAFRDPDRWANYFIQHYENINKHKFRALKSYRTAESSRPQG